MPGKTADAGGEKKKKSRRRHHRSLHFAGWHPAGKNVRAAQWIQRRHPETGGLQNDTESKTSKAHDVGGAASDKDRKMINTGEDPAWKIIKYIQSVYGNIYKNDRLLKLFL